MRTTSSRRSGERDWSIALRWRRPAAVALLCTVAACGGGGHHHSSNFSELLVVSDQQTVRSYAISGTTPVLVGSATIPGVPAAYSRAGTTVTVNMINHEIRNGLWVDLDFGPGVGGTATDGTYKVTVVDANTFTVTDSASGTITGGTLIRRPQSTLAGTYAQAGTVVTVTLTSHALANNDGVSLHFTSGAATDLTAVKLTVVDANTFTVTSPTAAATAGNVEVTIGTNYNILELAMHPGGQWLYATSAYDCSNGRPFCWAGDLVSRFGIDWSTGALTLQESVRSTSDTSQGDPSPVGLAFSPNGLHLFHQDDDLDGLRMWAVSPVDGKLTETAASASNDAFLHGVVVSADGTRVYNGALAFAVGTAPDTITKVGGPEGGDSTQIRGGVLLTASRVAATFVIRSYSLVNPDLPVMLSSVSTQTLNQARDLAVNVAGTRIVGSGFGGFKSYDFDGTTVTAVALAGAELRDGGLPFPTSGVRRMYRTVSMNAAGTLLASAYFTNDPNSGNGGLPPSGFVLVNLAADGTMTLAGDFPVATYARSARFLRKP